MTLRSGAHEALAFQCRGAWPHLGVCQRQCFAAHQARRRHDALAALWNHLRRAATCTVQQASNKVKEWHLANTLPSSSQLWHEHLISHTRC